MRENVRYSSLNVGAGCYLAKAYSPTLPITEEEAVAKGSFASKDSMMKAHKTGFLPFALGGLIALLLSQAVFTERLQAASPHSLGRRGSFGRQRQNPDRSTTPAMQFFGSRLPTTAIRQGLRGQMPAPQPLQLRGTKPFESLQRPPTLSPYHNLNRFESELGLPNYYTFVRPLQQQQNANRQQAVNLRKLQQKVRLATANGIVSGNPTGGVPTTGHSSQFLNLGGYFSDVR